MTTWRIEIAGPPPPRPGRGHWRAIHAAKNRWVEVLAWEARLQKIPAPETRRVVQIEFVRPGPISDKDNAYATAKVPLDALKRAGLIVDDSPRWVDLDVTTRTGRPSRTIILISDE